MNRRHTNDDNNSECNDHQTVGSVFSAWATRESRDGQWAAIHQSRVQGVPAEKRSCAPPGGTIPPIFEWLGRKGSTDFQASDAKGQFRNNGGETVAVPGNVPPHTARSSTSRSPDGPLSKDPTRPPSSGHSEAGTTKAN